MMPPERLVRLSPRPEHRNHVRDGASGAGRIGLGSPQNLRGYSWEDQMSGITVTPLKPSIGAEVSGVDLSRPLDAAIRETLAQALAEHLALVFHDQDLTPDQYLAAAETFG